MLRRRAPRAVRLRADDRALPRLRRRPRERCGTRAGSIASSAGARCASRRRRAASTSSRSTRRPSRSSARSLGLAFELEPFYAWAAGDDVLARIVPRLAGFRPALAPDPFEMLVGAITAQQVSLFSALAIRNRFVERFGERVGRGVVVPGAGAARGGDARRSSSRSASRGGRPSTSSGSRAPTSTSTRSRCCPTTRCARGSSRCAASGSGRRSGSSRATSRGRTRGRPATSRCGRRLPPLEIDAARVRFHPFENLSAHYLLLANRVP